MKVLVIALLALAGFSSVLSSPLRDAGKKVVCYFGSWAVYRPGNGRFDVESIDPFLCTHLIFGFTGLKNGVIASLDPWNDKCEEYGKGQFKRFTHLKTLNPSLKTSVAIGGWNEGSEKYSQMASTAAGRRRFIDSVIPFLQEFDFDGLDLDWEYPAARGGVPEDKQNFALLASELREEFNKYGYLLTAAVSAGVPTIRDAYDVPSISRSLDFINVMAYDFHGAWDKHTGHHAPLYRNPLDTGSFEVFNANSSIHYWLELGAPREKLILGMGTYGRGVTLDDGNVNGLYAPGNSPLRAGPYTREAGFWGYNELCEVMQNQQWTVVNDEYYKAPYAYRERDWIGYDDPASIKAKSVYARDMGLGGGMVWSLETDDFNGRCHGEGFPLIRTIYRTLIGEYTTSPKPTDPPRAWSNAICPKPTWWSPPAATEGSGNSVVTDAPYQPQPQPQPEQPTATQSPSPSQPEPEAHEICKSSGLNKDPQGDCSKFYNCVPEGNGWRVYPQKCAPGTAFDPESKTCTYPSAVPGCSGKVKAAHHYKTYSL